jgi:hypothetical protein
VNNDREEGVNEGGGEDSIIVGWDTVSVLAVKYSVSTTWRA